MPVKSFMFGSKQELAKQSGSQHRRSVSRPHHKVDPPPPNRLRPQLFAGHGNAGDVYRLGLLPVGLWSKLKKATYLGCGLSSDVWDLHDGTVLKITREPATVKSCQHLLDKPTLGLPKIIALYPNLATHIGFEHGNDWERHKEKEKCTAIIQEKYEPLPKEMWHRIQEEVKHIDLSDKPDRWARGSDGEPARGKEGEEIAYQLAVVSRKIKAKDPHHPLAACTVAMSTLHQWMKNESLGPLGGIDIDHRDNWGMNVDGKPVLMDPVFTCRKAFDASQSCLNPT